MSLNTLEGNTAAGLLLLEGNSATGKSYLANTIRRRYPNAVYVHCTYRWGKAMWTYHLAALRRALRHSQTRLCILDRSWPSEEIYAHIYRNGTAWPQEGRIMQKLLLKHAALNILCLTSVKDNLALIKEHRKKYHSPQFLVDSGKIAERYWDFWHGSPEFPGTRDFAFGNETYVDSVVSRGGARVRHDWLRYDVTTDGKQIETFVDSALEKLAILRSQQYQPALDFSQRNVAGFLPTAKYLLIGDRVNHHDYKKCWPFMAYANSSLFMAKMMHEAGLSEEEFMWTNACCPEEHIRDILRLKPNIVPIALGNAALKVTRNYDWKVPVRSIPHPSFGRRFMKPADWVEQLTEALA